MAVTQLLRIFVILACSLKDKILITAACCVMTQMSMVRFFHSKLISR